MKKLLLFWIFSGSLDGFSQVNKKDSSAYWVAPDGTVWIHEPNLVPDTIRATLIVYYDKGPAFLHTKPGFVIRQCYKDDIYLDDKKRVIKAPMEVLTYKLKTLQKK